MYMQIFNTIHSTNKLSTVLYEPNDPIQISQANTTIKDPYYTN